MAHEFIEPINVVRYGKTMSRAINMRNAFLKTEERKRKIESRSQDPRPGFMNDGDTFAYPHNQAGWGYWFPYYFVKHEGMLRKGKIHCSCPMCSAKTNNKRNRCYGPAHNPNMSDRRREDAMEYDLQQYFCGEVDVDLYDPFGADAYEEVI